MLRCVLLPALFLGVASRVSTSPVGNESTCYATDDTVYTADSCNSYDKQACDLSCTSDYCQTICGSSGTYSDFSCDSGSGALCAMDVFSNVSTTEAPDGPSVPFLTGRHSADKPDMSTHRECGSDGSHGPWHDAGEEIAGEPKAWTAASGKEERFRNRGRRGYRDRMRRPCVLQLLQR